jgi:thioredoxin-related protein
MKKNLLLTMLLLFGVSMTFAQIQFEDFDWKKLSQKAANENKLIMVDMTATWCGWCKYMDKNIFSKKKVGNFYNTHFISTKLYDTHPMGSKFNSKYDVDGFPTMLFLDSKGKLVYKIGGAMQDVDAFIQEGKMAKLKGNYVYNAGGNNTNGGSEEQNEDQTLAQLSFDIQMMAGNEDPDYEKAYQEFLEKPNAIGSEIEMDLTYELIGYGSELAAKQINQRRQSFDNKYGRQETIEALLSGGMSATLLKASEVLDPEKDGFAEDLEEMAMPIFNQFITDQSIAKSGMHLAIAAIFAEMEMLEESVDHMLLFAPSAEQIISNNEDLIDFYTFLAGSIYDEDRIEDYQTAVTYGEKAVALGGTGEVYEILSFIYDELGDDANANKYNALIED